MIYPRSRYWARRLFGPYLHKLSEERAERYMMAARTGYFVSTLVLFLTIIKIVEEEKKSADTDVGPNVAETPETLETPIITEVPDEPSGTPFFGFNPKVYFTFFPGKGIVRKLLENDDTPQQAVTVDTESTAETKLKLAENKT